MYIRYIEMNELRMQNSLFFFYTLEIKILDKNILIIMIVIVIIGIFILELYFLKNRKVIEDLLEEIL